METVAKVCETIVIALIGIVIFVPIIGTAINFFPKRKSVKTKNDKL